MDLMMVNIYEEEAYKDWFCGRKDVYCRSYSLPSDFTKMSWDTKCLCLENCFGDFAEAIYNYKPKSWEPFSKVNFKAVLTNGEVYTATIQYHTKPVFDIEVKKDE